MSTTVLKDVYFYYARANAPVENKADPTKPAEYKVDVLVSKADAKAWKKRFPKNKIKEMDSVSFKEAYKVDPPYEAEDDEYFILTLKKKAVYADGTELKPEHKPKVFMKENGQLVDRTTTLIANNSKGSASFDTYEVTKGPFPGTYPQFKALFVTDLIPYSGKGSSANNGSEFGEGAVASPASDFEDAPAPAPKAKAETPKKAVAKAKAVVEEAEEDSPF